MQQMQPVKDNWIAELMLLREILTSSMLIAEEPFKEKFKQFKHLNSFKVLRKTWLGLLAVK
jgi:hypothetical protein